MRTKPMAVFMLTCVLALSPWGLVAQDMGPYVGSPAFEQLRALEGSWEGTMDMGQGPVTITTSYKVTAGGSAMVETNFVGAPHEMVTVYHDNPKKKLTLTHYCMLHNQPKMVLVGSKKGELKFDLAKEADIDVKNEEHMHALTIKINSKDKMAQEWTGYAEGKVKHVMEIAYTRVK